jgi:RimJ/RimL family protein N-acetyltransferase
MSIAAEYTAIERLRDGRQITIRSLRPDDQEELLSAVGRVSAQSLYRRFFAVKRAFSDDEVKFFLRVDFTNHVALIAITEERGRECIVGGGRYIVVQPGTAELAFTVEDGHQGRGIGGVLLRHLVTLARQGGLKQLIAEVLPDNIPMQRVFERSGVRFDKEWRDGSIHISVPLV